MILVGDCREVLKTLPDRSVQCVVTSPPYFGLRDYKCEGQIGLEQTPEDYVAALVAVFREAKRVLRDDGTFWLNLGDCYNNIRSQMGPGQAVHGRDKLNGKPEPGSRRRGWAGLKEKDLIGIPWLVAFALRADGWYLRDAIIWAKPNPMPESVTDRCTKSYENVFLFSKRTKYYFDAAAIAEPAIDAGKTKGGTTGHVWYGTGGHNRDGLAALGQRPVTETRNRRNVWTIATEPSPIQHYAIMPTALAELCIKAGSRVGDTVLDPFGGAGTTGLVADRLQRRYVLIEANAEYAAAAEARIAEDAGMFLAPVSPLPNQLLSGDWLRQRRGAA